MKKIEKAKKKILISLLNSFNSLEMKEFSKLVECNYFNTDIYAVKLLNGLKEYVIGKGSFGLALQVKVFLATFSKNEVRNNVLNDKQKKLLRAKMSVLTKLGKQFLMQEALKETPIIQQTLLNNQLLKKQQYDLFKRVFNSEKQKANMQKLRDKEYYELSLALEKGQLDYLYQRGFILKEDNLAEVNFYLDLQYFLNKLELYSTMLSIRNIVPDKNYDFSVINIVAQALELPAYQKHPLLMLHKANIKLIKNYDKKSYDQLIDLLNQFDNLIPKDLLIDFYTVATNFCSIQIRKGKPEFYYNLFDLYQIMDNKDLIVTNEVVDIARFKNIILACCRVKAFDIAIGMINKYYVYIKKEVRKSVYHYNTGMVEFYKNNYKNAISHFIHVDKVSIIFDLEARIQLIKSYYELDQEYDIRTEQIFRTAERLVQSNRVIASNIKLSYKNFIQILINLYRVKHKVGKRTIESVINKLNKMTSINDKKWLLEKIKELE